MMTDIITLIDEENVEQDLPFALDLIESLNDEKLAMRLKLVNDIILEKDLQIDKVEKGLEIDGFEGDPTDCLKRIEQIRADREQLVDTYSNILTAYISENADKKEITKCIKSIEAETRRLNGSEEKLVSLYIKGLKESSEFAKLCKKKVHTKYGSLILAGEVIVFFLILFLQYFFQVPL